MKSFYYDKTILVTGAASGIGRQFAKEVSRYGVTLLLWDRNREPLIKLINVLDSSSTALDTVVDVTDRDAVVYEAGQLIQSRYIPDIIVNCAGTVTGKWFHEHSYDEIEKTMAINTTGSMYVVRAFLPEMLKRNSGRIVNISSASGYIGNPKMSVYAASKWAILGWSESLRLELKRLDSRVGVTCIIPSYVNTGMFDGVRPPRLMPMLNTDRLVYLMMKGIRRGRFKVQAPILVRAAPFLKGILPQRMFDWIAGRLLQVYQSMDTFRGKE